MDSQDDFQDYVFKATQIALHREQNLPGYSVPYFSDQPNRNHFNDRPQGGQIKQLVLHYTAENLLDSLITMTRDAISNRVSAHYVITETETPPVIGGTLVQVVPEAKRAWHAGISSWQETEGLNDTSIGVELVNLGIDRTKNWIPFDPHQIKTLGSLSQKIVQAYNVNPTCVIGHEDIAPSRKQDPGPLFPWGLLYEQYGVGAWLSADEQTPEAIRQKYHPREQLPEEPDLEFLATYLKAYGYAVPETGEWQALMPSLRAFQAHFSKNQSPEHIGNAPDEKDMFWIWGLVAKYHRMEALNQGTSKTVRPQHFYLA
ncbi:MAG: N-acetylmuramoyl-L-alanine amidase [Alphaproteobacteria bacterium]